MRAIDIVQVKREIQSGELAVELKNNDVLLTDKQSGEAVCIATLTPPNEPLTLEQLREMDGEPVWVTPLGFWALVISKPGERVQFMSNDGETVWADKEIELVGPVYRRPPEGEEDT